METKKIAFLLFLFCKLHGGSVTVTSDFGYGIRHNPASQFTHVGKLHLSGDDIGALTCSHCTLHYHEKKQHLTQVTTRRTVLKKKNLTLITDQLTLLPQEKILIARGNVRIKK